MMALDADITHFITAFLLVLGGLLPVVNPLGSAPIFLGMTHGVDPGTRSVLAFRVAVNAFVLLFGSIVLGTVVLRMFGLSVPVVQVAGGAVVCWLGWSMLTDNPSAQHDKPPEAGHEVLTRAFYPLTLPLTVDPGAISVAVTLGANHAHGIERVAIALVASILALATISATVWLAYRYAEPLGRWLGHSRMMVVLRLSAFILLCIGVQIAWNGVRTLIGELPRTPAEPGRSSQAAPPAVGPKHPAVFTNPSSGR
jgi:multiple antibiotic resistance protein